MIVFILICAALAGVAAFRIASPMISADQGRTGILVGLGVIAFVMTGALGVYAVNGKPGEAGAPYAEVTARLSETDPSLLTPAEQEERLRAMLRHEPENVEALTMLGRFLSRTERELEAISLFERALRIEEDARTLSDLGQALVVLNESQVTVEAERAFAAARSLDPALPEPAFFLGAAYYERGDRRGAAEIWSDIIGRLNEGDPFRAAIAARAADLLSRPSGGPDSEGAAPFADAAANGVAPEDLIESMVGGLQARLEEDPDDLSGWLTLARARLMQGEIEAGAEALNTARIHFEADTGALAMIGAMQPAFSPEESDQ